MNYHAARATVLTVLLAFPVTGLPATGHGELSHSKIEKLTQVAGPGMPGPVLQKAGLTVEVAGPGMPGPVLQKAGLTVGVAGPGVPGPVLQKAGSGLTVEVAGPGVPGPVLQKAAV